MNELNEKIKQGYDNAELPEELRLKVRREFLTAAENRKEGDINMSRKIKRPVAIGLIAAAALTVSITAGAASGIFHKESIDHRLGEGAADTVMSTVELQSVSTENDYFRITADAVFCDGKSVMIYMTKERLTDPELAWEYYDEGFWSDNINISAAYADDGTQIDEVTELSDPKEEITENGWYHAYIEPSENGVTYEVCELDDIEAGRPVELTFWDSTENNDPAILEGLSLTVDTAQNFSPITFADENGRELYLTPYRLDTYASDLMIMPFDLTLINSATGEEKTFRLKDGAGYDDYSWYNYNELIPDIEQYDALEIENVGTFYRQ